MTTARSFWPSQRVPVTTARAEAPSGQLLGSGGEADVFAVPGRPHLAFKRYRGIDAERDRKLLVMAELRPDVAGDVGSPGRRRRHVTAAWPEELVFTRDGRVEGFLMPRAGRGAVPIFQLYNPATRRAIAPEFTWRYLVRTARNVAGVVDALHRAGVVIGDLNESNLLVTHQALVTLVDCDSVQVADPATGEVHLCRVAKAEFLSPELRGADLAVVERTPASDNFALAVLVHLLLREGLHPFAGVWRGRGRDDPPELADRMAMGAFPVGLFRRQNPPPLAVPLDVLPRKLRSLLRQAVVAGRRRPGRRPSAGDWVAALDAVEADLATCRRSTAHVYPGHRRRCPWCERMAAGLPDPFPRPGPPLPPPTPPAWRRALGVLHATSARAAGAVTPVFEGLARGATRIVPPVTLVVVGLWLVPLITALVAVIGLPVADEAASSTSRRNPRDASGRWPRWRRITAPVRLGATIGRTVVAGGRLAATTISRTVRWSLGAVLVGAVAASVVALTLDLVPPDLRLREEGALAARVAVAVFTVAHVIAGWRAGLFTPLGSAVGAASDQSVAPGWPRRVVWASTVAAIAVALTRGGDPWWWPLPV